MIRIAQAVATEELELELTFENGVSGTVDFSELATSPLFSPLANDEFFESVTIVRDGRALAWGEELEICADSLFLRITGKKPEEIFSKTKATL
ncbi:conserved hypothetical protein [Mesotoga infera]|nr:conserved hypothetical protein [Mesotoga infera]